MGIKEFYSDAWLTVYHGDAAAMLRTLEPESVHCVVTSPPYWGLRDYGTATWTGGDEGCPHRVPATGSTQNKGNNNREGVPFAATCGLCGAIREDGQLGLEATPEAYVAALVGVFREVRRVLRKDGTVWLVLGDSYAGGNTGTTIRWEGAQPGNSAGVGTRDSRNRDGLGRVPGLKPKDLVGIPWMVAFALRADGWYLRSEIIWAKPNPMPESVTDRPTKSHETIFLLSKSSRYYFDADAVREAGEGRLDRSPQSKGRLGSGGKQYIDGAPHLLEPAGRNIRSVWTVATAPYPGAHFATFPPKLIEPAIKAGTSEKGVCPECGAPWIRVVERETENRSNAGKAAARSGVVTLAGKGHPSSQIRAEHDIRLGPSTISATTTGWRPSCAHVSPLPPRPAVVLDPFAGSGTSGMVAQSLGRRAVLIDLSMDYLGQLMDRNRDIPLGLETA